MEQVVVAGMAVFFLAMGLYGLAAPAALVRPFGMEAATADARTEVRAVYGGFGVAVAAALVLAVMREEARDGIVLAVGMALGGMAFGRLVARCVERPSGFYPSWFYFWVEAAGALALAACAR
ncbi:DUF4345 domain-containing protein [Actinomadura kijaniata]|uniref:DUF4345 domain-containing protein n=1 Tax=Actinomadura kijaniata TaxID=46161 RepID=UPI0008335998|nr:DUF4345 domain-containing protein [Actinomadura kijaniata]